MQMVDNYDHCGFNTQPPEGGWTERPVCQTDIGRFNTQPPEGGWKWN